MSTMHKPPHPGQVLREYMPGHLSMTELAMRIGVSRQAFSKLLNGWAGVSAEMACRLAGAQLTSAEFWMNLQQAYDLWQVRCAGAVKVPPLAA